MMARIIICVCGYLLRYMFVPLFSAYLQTIIGGFAAYSPILISSFNDVIGGIIDYINGYEFAAALAAYLPNYICLFEGLFTPGVGVYCTTVCGFVVVFAALLSNICEFHLGVFDYIDCVDYVQDIILNYYHNTFGLIFLVFLLIVPPITDMDPFFAPVSGISFIDNDIFNQYSQLTGQAGAVAV